MITAIIGFTIGFICGIAATLVVACCFVSDDDGGLE